MQKVTSLILQAAMVMGSLYFRINVVRANLSHTQEQVSADATRALELIKQAREAMGGEEALKGLGSLSISGNSRRSFQDKEGQAQERSAKFQIHFALTKKFTERATLELPPPPPGGFGREDRVVLLKRAPAPGDAGASVDKPEAFSTAGPRKRVLRLDRDGPPMMLGAPVPMHPIHFLMTSLLGAPAPFKVEYSYAGETRLEAGDADIVEAKYPGGMVVRMMLDKQTHLPLSLTYRAMMPPPHAGNIVVFRNRIGKDGEREGVLLPAPEASAPPDVLIRVPEGVEEDVLIEGNASLEKFQIPLPPPEEVDVQVSISDFRVVNGILLPYRITQNFNGKGSETWEVEKYEVNSPPEIHSFREKK